MRFSVVVCFCGKEVFKMNIEVCCHLMAVVLCCLDSILLSVGRSLSSTFSFQPLFVFFLQIKSCHALS